MLKGPLSNIVYSALLSCGILCNPAEATIDDTRMQTSHILGANCQAQVDDLHRLGELYTIQKGDTFSQIAANQGYSYDDFILALKILNPGINIYATIHPGDQFYILAKDRGADFKKYQNTFGKLTQINEIKAAVEAGDMETVAGYLRFDITPSVPVNLGVRNAYESVARMFGLGKRIAPRSALPEIEDQAVCKHVLSQTFTRFVGLNSEGIVKIVRDIMTRENTPAWILPYELEKSGIYERQGPLDLRDNFNLGFSHHRVAIRGNDKDRYSQGLLYQLDFLRTDEAVGCFIPTLFQGTTYSDIAREESSGRDMNSHIFACNGFSYSEVFDREKYGFDTHIDGDFSKVLIAMIRDLGTIQRYQSASDNDILNGLRHIRDYIVLEIQVSDGTWVPLEFDENLQIINLGEIKSIDIQGFRTGGNILTDGFQITKDGNRSIIEQRLSPDWTVYASHYFKVFHPTSILVASKELLDAASHTTAGKYIPDIPIRQFISVNTQQHRTYSITDKYKDTLALQVYQLNYGALNDTDKVEIDSLYQVHSLGLQIMGYHSFNGIDWNPGAVYINAPVPFLDIFTDDQISQMQAIYRKYIADKRSEYITLMSEECSEGNQLKLPVLYFRYFPGETSSSLWNTLIPQVRRHSETLATSMQSLLPNQRMKLIAEIFGDEIVAGNIPSGGELILNSEVVIQKIQLYLDQGTVSPRYIEQLSYEDHDLLKALIVNPETREALAYYLIKEGYVPNKWSQRAGGPFGFIVDATQQFLSRFNRKNQKIYYEQLADNGALAKNKQRVQKLDGYTENIERTLEYLPEVGAISSILRWPLKSGNKAIGAVRDTLAKVPEYGPQSYGDLQMRLTNLLNSENAFALWPSKKDIENALTQILNPSTELQKILDSHREAYPSEHADDMRLVYEIEQALQQENPSGEKVYRLLIELFELNDSTNKHIIGKVISISLSEALHGENIGHICEQLRRSGENCHRLNSEQLEALYAYGLLAMNKGPSVALTIATENYLLRVFQALQQMHEIALPQVEVRYSTGITKKPVLNYFEFRARLEGYKQHYSNYTLEYQDIEDVIRVIDIFLSSSENISQKHFDLLSDKRLKEILTISGNTSFLLPTNDEIRAESNGSFETARKIFFAYNNPEYIQDFIPEPERKISDFVIAPFLLFVIIGQSLIAMVQGVWKLTEKRRKRIKYLKSIILTNDPGNPYKKGEYKDGVYLIGVDKKGNPTMVLRVDEVLTGEGKIAAE